MSNNQNKGEKKCPFCGKIVANIFECDCPLGDMKIAPQSVEKESEGKKYTMMAQRGSGKTYVKKIMDKMFNQIQDNAELTNYPKKPFIPQSNTLGTTMEEEKEEEKPIKDNCTRQQGHSFKEGCEFYNEKFHAQASEEERLREEFNKWHSSETTFAYGTPKGITIADWWLEKLSQSKAETIKEIYMHASLYSDGSYTLLHNYLKQKYPDILTLLSKDIEQ